MSTPSYLNFDKTKYKWRSDIDYRKHPENYRVGKGEQGVLLCQPYKNEILPFWQFKDRVIALESSEKIYQIFLKYLENEDFIGADMARKFLQMGFTRARRYTNYKGGRKYRSGDYLLLEKGTGDPEKAISADIFFHKWKDAEKNPKYMEMKREWKEKYG
ncbi:MAG: DUF4385 domain-containing protein [Janthinobacterium lividum]